MRSFGLGGNGERIKNMPRPVSIKEVNRYGYVLLDYGP